MSDDDRYTDPGLPAQDNPGEISGAALESLHAMLLGRLSDHAAFARWFGKYSSTPKYPEIDWRPEEPVTADQLRGALATGAPLQRNPASRYSFIQQEGGSVLLFVDGECFECSGHAAELAKHLCGAPSVEVAADLIASDPAMDLVAALYNQGSLAFEAED